MDQVEFTKDEISNHSMGNASGHLLGTISFLNSKGASVEEWIEYVGKQHAEGWGELKGKSALEVLREAALTWISCGATLVSLSGDDARAEAVLAWPPEDDAKFYGITTRDGHKLNHVFLPIAQKVGLDFSWESEGKQFRITFSR